MTEFGNLPNTQKSIELLEEFLSTSPSIVSVIIFSITSLLPLPPSPPPSFLFLSLSTFFSLIEDTIDLTLQSWAWWQFKSFHDITTSGLGTSESFYDENGNLQAEKVKALSRTYAQSVAGTITSMSFSPRTSVFELRYTANTV